MLLFPLTAGCFIYHSLRKHETKQVKSFSALHQVTLYGYQHCRCVQSHADFHPWGIMKMAPPWAPRRLQSTKSQHSTAIDFHLKQQCCFSTGLWSASCCGAHISKIQCFDSVQRSVGMVETSLSWDLSRKMVCFQKEIYHLCSGDIIYKRLCWKQQNRIWKRCIVLVTPAIAKVTIYTCKTAPIH